VLVDLLVLTVAVTATLSSWPLLVTRWGMRTPMLGLRETWIVLPLIVGMVVIAFTAIEHLCLRHRATVVAVTGAFLGTTVLLMLTRKHWLPLFSGDASLALALGLFLATILIGLPVGFALLTGTFVYLYASGVAPMVALPQNMVEGTGMFVMLALPFFIFAGILMEQGGISKRLIRFVHAAVGHLRGGLLQVMVVSMYIVSGLSGSKAADVAAVGSVMRDTLRPEGYSLEEGAAVLAASAAMGETVPPSLGILVLGSITTLSMGALFLAGLVPAAVLALCLMALIYERARRTRAYASSRGSLRLLASSALGALLPLLMPVCIVVGIVFGIATPTEVSSFAVVYGLALSVIGYRELGRAQFIRSVVDCSNMAGVLLFIMGAATSFSWALTIGYLPQRLVEILSSVHESQWLFMGGSMVLLIVTGSVLDGLPALLILAPLLVPIAGQVGISPLHYGIVLLIAMGIGASAPPVGVVFYVTCAVCESDIDGTIRVIFPFLIVLCIGLLFVAFVPWFTLVLPRAFNLGG
jgi:tripartite ATP-independent transporter DctM subunit